MRRRSYDSHLTQADIEQALNKATGSINSGIRNKVGNRLVGVDALAQREAILVGHGQGVDVAWNPLMGSQALASANLFSQELSVLTGEAYE
ncbi:Alpha/beta hydrolase fold protein (plasmid) [Pseudomonas putida]|jgi:hypothetical protein|uniref:Alpha/beta hydrolase fold protein n=1 Tax=Pseudomonas putida TaxID=303 RepID=A0A1L7NMR9_PSEPU|nr:Alpha/beta hydrolase fold protein [Pseudomonas putida]